MNKNKEKVEKLIRQIYTAVRGLNKIFPERPFTPDGHMVGSIGEMYGTEYYGIKLLGITEPIHDGEIGERKVQIKATQRSSVDLKGETDLLLVLKIKENGDFEEIYNGDGKRPWQLLLHRKPTRAGEKSISLNQLRKLNDSVESKDRIKRLP
jgi:hypothetical protein